MFLPLNNGSTNDWPSKKSLPQPRFGQIATSAFGTPQNFDSIVGCCTWRYVSLKPSCWSWFWMASPVFEAGAWLSPTIRTGLPVYLPLEKPAFFMYDSARVRSPLGFLSKSAPGPAAPPASS